MKLGCHEVSCELLNQFVPAPGGNVGVSGRMVVVLVPDKQTDILGVTLDFTDKTLTNVPAFKTNSVYFEW